MTFSTMAASLRGSAAAVAVALPLAAAPALAQESTSDGATSGSSEVQSDPGQQQTEQSDDSPSGEAGQSGDTPSGQSDDAASGPSGDAAGLEANFDPEMRVATVNGAEIVGGDVAAFLQSLPPQLRQQQPQMLLSLAMQQLVLRELIIQEADSDNLADDPDVAALLEQSEDTSEEDAMVQVWLQREFDERIDDAAVQESYDQAASQMGADQEMPPLEEVRPQIEQGLRQQTLGEIRSELQQDAEVTFYDTEGEPIESAPDSGEGDAVSPQSPNAASSDSGQSSNGAPGGDSGNSDSSENGSASQRNSGAGSDSGNSADE